MQLYVVCAQVSLTLLLLTFDWLVVISFWWGLCTEQEGCEFFLLFLTTSSRHVRSNGALYILVREHVCVVLKQTWRNPNLSVSSGLCWSQLCANCVTFAPFLSSCVLLIPFVCLSVTTREHIAIFQEKPLTLWFWVNIFQLFTYVLFCCTRKLNVKRESLLCPTYTKGEKFLGGADETCVLIYDRFHRK